MKRLDSVLRPPFRAAAVLGLLAATLLGPAGCFQKGQQVRQQAEDEKEQDRYGVRTVGEVTVVSNVTPTIVGGVGLVENLQGTGGGSPPDKYRAEIEQELRKQRVPDIKKLLASTDHAIVLVQGQIVPGTAKGDRIDLEITLPPGSRVTSLRGGRLCKCMLYNYDYTHRLDPRYPGQNEALRGHPIVEAEGAILAGMGEGDEAARNRQGRIWRGGHSKIEVPLGLMMVPNQQFARISNQVATRINDTFFTSGRSPDNALAEAKNNVAVVLHVPVAYKHNLPRYLRVVRFIPLYSAESAGSTPDARNVSYVQRLANDLHDPKYTVEAALRLEALGHDSIRILKSGLEDPNTLVRFCAAEALAYLGEPLCADELAKAIAEQPALRAFGLTALASLDEAACQLRLQDLLLTSADDETRYGAFRALRTLNEHNDVIRGELLNDSFWLHRVPSQVEGLVHFTTMQRAEVVLFGQEAFLKPDFAIQAGDFTLRATPDDTRCSIAWLPLSGGSARRMCSLRLEDVLRTMAELGGTYPDVVSLLQQLDALKRLTCRVRNDALPQAVSVYDLVSIGRESGKDGAEELLRGAQDLGATPSLYERGVPGRLNAPKPEARLHHPLTSLPDEPAHGPSE